MSKLTTLDNAVRVPRTVRLDEIEIGSVFYGRLGGCRAGLWLKTDLGRCAFLGDGFGNWDGLEPTPVEGYVPKSAELRVWDEA